MIFDPFLTFNSRHVLRLLRRAAMGEDPEALLLEAQKPVKANGPNDNPCLEITLGPQTLNEIDPPSDLRGLAEYTQFRDDTPKRESFDFWDDLRPAPDEYTIEPHGPEGCFAIYHGRSNQHHGYNLGRLTETNDATIDTLTRALAFWVKNGRP